jgi:hypothetical protein
MNTLNTNSAKDRVWRHIKSRGSDQVLINVVVYVWDKVCERVFGSVRDYQKDVLNQVQTCVLNYL